MDNGASSYRRFLDGDDSGIVEIIREYKDGLILYLCGFTDNIYTAEDLMEDTFVKLVTKKPRFSGKSTFKTWLYAIARNVALDHQRKTACHRAVSLDDLPQLPADEADLEWAYFQEARKVMVHKALRQLKPEYRQILYLVYFEGFTNPQAASIMKKTRRQIENLVYRAKASLRSQLDKEGFTYEEL